MRPEDGFGAALRVADQALSQAAGREWNVRAGPLEWTCWQTADHIVDCLFSYALQFSAQCEEGFLPFQELHALADATNEQLLLGLRDVGAMFHAMLSTAQDDTFAGDGLIRLDASGWARRGCYELLLHSHDRLSGLGEPFLPPADLCGWVSDCDTLWMLDRGRAATAADPWSALLLGSGRSA